MTERRRFLLNGAVLVAVPAVLYYLWIAIAGPDFIADKVAPYFRIDERLVYIWYCVGSLIIQIFAIRLLNRCVRAPIDFLSVFATGIGLLSLLVMVFMFVMIIGITMGGAG
jgi:hypothetical protein